MNQLNGFGTMNPRGIVEIAPKTALELPPEVRFIDVREPDEFTGELGHLERAELVPLATVLDKAAEWDKLSPLLLICRSGARSSRAAAALVEAGFPHIANLTGGMMAVRAAGI